MVNQIKMESYQIQKMSLKVLTTKYGSKYFPSKQGLYYNNQKHLKVKNLFEFKILGSNDFQKAEIIKRASKYQADIQIVNINNLNYDVISNIDWKSVDKWNQYSQEKVLINSSVNNFSDFNITNTKLDELNKWKTHKIYDTVDNCKLKIEKL